MSIKKFFNGALAILLIAALLTSCQKDELDNLPEENTENVENEENEETSENGIIATDIFSKSETEDEDEEFCLEANFPITVIYPDGTTQQTADEAELDQIMDDFYDNQSEGSEDELLIQFPISFTLEDGTVVTANSEEEIGEILLEHCFGMWDDYEDDFGMGELCFDINFPISLSLDGTTQTINTLEELENTIEMYVQANPDADEDDIEVQYPIDVTLEDGTVVSVSSDDEFEELLDEECFGDFGDFAIFGLCFDITFPVLININGTTQTLNSIDELIFTVMMYLENNPDAEEGDVTMQYPIDVTLEDGTLVTVNSEDEFEELVEEECFGDFGDFGDFETGDLCFNINFPISISLGGTIQILNNLQELILAPIIYLETNPDAEEDDIAIQYPIDVTLEDDTVVAVNSDDEFEELLVDECE